MDEIKVTPVEENQDVEKKLEVKEAEPVKVEKKGEENDYFVYINRLVTSALSSFISVGLIFASVFLMQSIFGEGALDTVEIKSSLAFMMFAVLALFLGQFLQNYFVKIIEKEQYGFVLGKSFKNLIWQLILLTGFIPVFVTSSYIGKEALLASVIMFAFANNLLSVSIRESEHAVRQQASIVGMFLGTGLWSAFVWNLFANGADAWMFSLLMIIPIQAIVAELFVAVADVTSKYFK